MTTYLERLREIKTLGVSTDKTDETDKSGQNSPSVSFDSFVSSGEGGNFLGKSLPDATPSVSFGSASSRESVNFSVRCGECRHSILYPATCPVYGWRCCAVGRLGGFAREPHRCEAWQAIVDGLPATPLDPLAARIEELIAQGWAPWNARARAEGEAMESRS